MHAIPEFIKRQFPFIACVCISEGNLYSVDVSSHWTSQFGEDERDVGMRELCVCECV